MIHWSAKFPAPAPGGKAAVLATITGKNTDADENKTGQ